MNQEEINQIVFEYIYTVNKKSGSLNNEDKIKKVTAKYIKKHISSPIITDIEFDEEQLEALYILNDFCAYQALCDYEVIGDIRKLSYIANANMKKILVSIGLSSAMIAENRKTNETKEFFDENIVIYQTEDDEKVIDFGMINPQRFLDAITYEMIDDCKIYFNIKGFGLKSLMDYKTKLKGLNNFKQGGDNVSEFARFQRKYQELLNSKEENAKESAQDAFRTSMVASIANKFTEQQMLEGKTIEDMMLMVENLFSTEKSSFNKAQKNLPKKNNIKRLGKS